jgi:hypothetical protein
MDKRQNLKNRHAGGAKRWLRDYPWDNVIRPLSIFWHRPPEEFDTPSARQIREVWERESDHELTLAEALRVCRRCQMAMPFGKYDCDSFVIIAREIVKPFLSPMSATLAAAVITILGDYIRGVGDDREMKRALNLILERAESMAAQSVSPATL